MSTSYNLRSSQRKKHVPVEELYLKSLSGSPLSEHSFPKVNLERLKVLECSDYKNCRFFLQKDKIVRKSAGRLSKKKKILKFSCVVLLLVTSIIYWRGSLQLQGFNSLKNIKTFYTALKNYYIDTFEMQGNKTEKSNSTNHTKNDTRIKESLSMSSPSFSLKNFDMLNNNFEIRKMVEDHFLEFSQMDELLKQEARSFIEEQCGRETHTNLTDSFQFLKSSPSSSDYFSSADINDYALESRGAKIVSIFDTEPYGTVMLKFLDYNFGSQLNDFIFKYFTSVGPSSILVPWKKAGDCWAFKGSLARIQIQLSERITVTAVTIDHIPRDRSPNGNINSAPKKFLIFGVEENSDEPLRTFLSEFEYSIEGPSLQTFPVAVQAGKPFRNVEFVIKSNHGNDFYTCVYKIRVHGYK